MLAGNSDVNRGARGGRGHRLLNRHRRNGELVHSAAKRIHLGSED